VERDVVMPFQAERGLKSGGRWSSEWTAPAHLVSGRGLALPVDGRPGGERLQGRGCPGLVEWLNDCSADGRQEHPFEAARCQAAAAWRSAGSGMVDRRQAVSGSAGRWRRRGERFQGDCRGAEFDGLAPQMVGTATNGGSYQGEVLGGTTFER
jgi:hypothetical protein